MRKSRTAAENDEKYSVSRRVTAMFLLLLMLVITTYAWFVMNKANSGGGVHLDVVPAESISSSLYEIVGSGNVKVDTIFIDQYIPGESRHYRADIDNSAGSSDYRMIAGFSNFSAVIPAEDTANGFTGSLELCNVITLSDVYATSSGERDPSGDTFREGILSSLADDNVISEGDSVTFATGVLIPHGQVVSVYFTLTLDEDAGNEYQNLICYIKQISTVFS